MIAIIINPISGAGATSDAGRQRAALASAIVSASSEDAEILVTERRGHARELAFGAVARGARLIMAWGGDGTMNEVGTALLFGDTPMAIVPSGSGNGLARELGIDFRPEQAIRRAIHARPQVIDAGELGGRAFFSIAGVGFDAHVAACMDRERRRGFPAYARITAREIWAYRSGTYRITGYEENRAAILVTLANASQFGNGARIAPNARIDDGLLDLVVVGETSRWRTITGLPRLFAGGLTRLRTVSSTQIERVTIEADQPMTFHVDGEPVEGGTTLEGRVLPGALKICTY